MAQAAELAAQDHSQILNQVKARDVEGARRAMEKHLARTRQVLEDLEDAKGEQGARIVWCAGTPNSLLEIIAAKQPSQLPLSIPVRVKGIHLSDELVHRLEFRTDALGFPSRCAGQVISQFLIR
jgi:hypothetical protein